MCKNISNKTNKGFTLIEIIAVVIIIGIIALIVVPSVSSYIANTRKTTYYAHEKTMEEAAKSMTIEVINGKDSFALPKRGDHAEVFLSELINKEYLETLKDPNTNEACNESMSYVIIKNTGNDDYDFQPCLYCGSYITESDECTGVSTEDHNKPVCGIITGESSEWTNQSRTITVGCSDTESGCTRSKFTKVFNTTTDKGTIQISDKSGKTENCEVNVRVDKTPPTCELVAEGDENIETTGWSSGRTVVVKYKAGSRKDEHSGMLTYGIGTSIKNRSYNKLESYAIENLSGTTTIIGYVKDNAGNEGVCYKTVTTGLEKPVFDVRYGYQIYPKKERFALNGASQIGDNQIKTTNTTPTITFQNMSKYTNVTAVIMEFTEGIEVPSSFKLTVGGETYTAAPDNAAGNRLRFYIETEPGLNSVSSKSDYVITLGNKKDITYTITRIEIEQKDGNRVALHNVAVNLITRKAVVKTTRWIWDDSNNWETNYNKLFDPTTGAKSGNARVKNDIPLTSNPVAYSIVEGDKTGPTISITSGNTNWTNQDIVLTGKLTDTGTGLIGYMWSTSDSVNYYDTGWKYLDNPTTAQYTPDTYTISKNGTYYLYGKDEAGNVSKNSITVTNIDKRVPTCSAISEQAYLSCSDPAKTDDYGQSKIVKYYWGTESNPAVSKFKDVTSTATFTFTETATSGNGTRYYVFVIDEAGNRSAAKSDLYYTVTYDKNGDGTITKTSDIRRKDTNADLGDAFKATKNGYTFKGWNTSSTATTKLSSYKVTADSKLYAVWAITNPTGVTLTGAATKIYGSSDTTITCTQNKTYAAGTTIYYSFGYSTSENGNPGNWTTASTTNTLTIGKTNYYGDRYYYCNVYAKNSYLTSETIKSGKQLVRYNNAKISFDGNTGTVNGTNPVYVRTGSASSYTEIRNNTATANPTASKSCYTFNGWYTAKSSGSQVLKNDGKLSGTAVTGYTSKTTWTAIENKSLYAQWTARTYSVSYDLDKGSYGTNHPTSATYDTAFTVNNPTKSVTVSFSLGSSGGTASSTNNITKSYTFTGWKITDMDSVTHYYGSSTTTSTSISSTTATSFKNLHCGSGTVNFLALWKAPNITLPTVTRRGYTCKWVSSPYEWVSGGTYTPSDSGGATSRTMTASCSPNTYSCTAGKYLDVDTTCKTCPAGSYCPGGTWVYNDANQGINPCPTGYTSDAGKSEIGQCKKDCSAGTYLGAKAATCSTCTTGNYCVGGTFYYKNEIQGLTKCPGDMTSDTGKSAKTDCKIKCNGGNYLKKSGSSCSTCDKNNYCGGGTYYYSDSGNQGITACPSSYPYSSGGSTKIQNCYTGASRYKVVTTQICVKKESWTVTSKTCGSSTSYDWSAESTGTGTSCSDVSFSCDSSHSGQTYVSCSSNSCISGSNTCSGSYYWSCAQGSCGQNANQYTSCSTNSSCVRRYNSCASGKNTCVAGYNISYRVCNANTTYAFGTASTAYDQSSCSSNYIDCDASHVNQTHVSCTDTSTYPFNPSVYYTSTTCSTTPWFECNSSRLGWSYISNCDDGDYYCSSGTLSGSACYSP